MKIDTHYIFQYSYKGAADDWRESHDKVGHIHASPCEKEDPRVIVWSVKCETARRAAFKIAEGGLFIMGGFKTKEFRVEEYYKFLLYLIPN
jgi:hypothetical protein